MEGATSESHLPSEPWRSSRLVPDLKNGKNVRRVVAASLTYGCEEKARLRARRGRTLGLPTSFQASSCCACHVWFKLAGGRDADLIQGKVRLADRTYLRCRWVGRAGANVMWHMEAAIVVGHRQSRPASRTCLQESNLRRKVRSAMGDEASAASESYLLGRLKDGCPCQDEISAKIIVPTSACLYVAHLLKSGHSVAAARLGMRLTRKVRLAVVES